MEQGLLRSELPERVAVAAEVLAKPPGLQVQRHPRGLLRLPGSARRNYKCSPSPCQCVDRRLGSLNVEALSDVLVGATVPLAVSIDNLNLSP